MEQRRQKLQAMTKFPMAKESEDQEHPLLLCPRNLLNVCLVDYLLSGAKQKEQDHGDGMYSQPKSSSSAKQPSKESQQEKLIHKFQKQEETEEIKCDSDPEEVPKKLSIAAEVAKSKCETDPEEPPKKLSKAAKRRRRAKLQTKVLIP